MFLRKCVKMMPVVVGCFLCVVSFLPLEAFSNDIPQKESYDNHDYENFMVYKLIQTYTDDVLYNEVCWLTSHNSYAYKDPNSSVNFLPNQVYPIEEQLRRGVRSFMIDLHYDDEHNIILAHEGILFKQPFLPFLKTIKKWLDEHRKDIITVHLESYITGPDLVLLTAKRGDLQQIISKLPKEYDGLPVLIRHNNKYAIYGMKNARWQITQITDIDEAVAAELKSLPFSDDYELLKRKKLSGIVVNMLGTGHDSYKNTYPEIMDIIDKKAGLKEYLFDLRDFNNQWPCLGKMRMTGNHGKRLVIFSDKRVNVGYGIMHTANYMETEYNLRESPACEKRGDNRAYNSNLFVMNHFYPVPLSSAPLVTFLHGKAPYVGIDIYYGLNSYKNIVGRVCDCLNQERKFPNFIAVDNVGIGGDEVLVVLDINKKELKCDTSIYRKADWLTACVEWGSVATGVVIGSALTYLGISSCCNCYHNYRHHQHEHVQ